MFTIVWQSAALAVSGILLLRISGRKSISQMTIPQVGILLTIGTILGSQVAGKGLVQSLLAAGVFLLILYLSEWVTLKWNASEIALKGAAVPVIENGALVLSNMKRLRVTVDDLEKRLRLAGIARATDVKTATIENNGELGYELMSHARPVTRRDLEELLAANFPQIRLPSPAAQPDIFAETLKPSRQPAAPDKLH